MFIDNNKIKKLVNYNNDNENIDDILSKSKALNRLSLTEVAALLLVKNEDNLQKILKIPR